MPQLYLFAILAVACSSPVLAEEQFPTILNSPSSRSTATSVNSPTSLVSRDVYYTTQNAVSGSRASRLDKSSYPSSFVESRLIIWAVAQQHMYWGGCIVGGLFLVIFLEFIGLLKGEEAGRRYDALAQAIHRILMFALALAAILGGVLLMSLMVLYPHLTSYLVSIFRSVFLLYGGLVILYMLLVYLYYYGWRKMCGGFKKWVHASIGVLVNMVGMSLTLIGNAWSSFMMSPAGVDEHGRYLGNVWHAIHTALWNPLNLHRVVSHIMLSAGVVAAYGAYRAMTATYHDERAWHDWMAYVAFLFLIFALFTMPFGGYWLSREIYAYQQQMGIALFGGLLAWLGIMLVTLIGLFFLGINYYLWQRIDAAGGSSRYSRYSKYVFGILVLSIMVYVTPHTIVMTPLELQQMGGQQHQVIGNFGVESAKMAAVSMMIITTLWSLILWWQCQESETDARTKSFSYGLMAGFLTGALNILVMSVYGYYVPANVRIGMQLPLVGTVVVLIAISVVVAFRSSRHSWSAAQSWGLLSTRGYVALIGLAFLTSWVMGLGGYRRSAVRLYWHINGIVRDGSPWAFTPSIGFATNLISLNAIVFWLALFFVFWLAGSQEYGKSQDLSS